MANSLVSETNAKRNPFLRESLNALISLFLLKLFWAKIIAGQYLRQCCGSVHFDLASDPDPRNFNFFSICFTQKYITDFISLLFMSSVFLYVKQKSDFLKNNYKILVIFVDFYVNIPRFLATQIRSRINFRESWSGSRASQMKHNTDLRYDSIPEVVGQGVAGVDVEGVPDLRQKVPWHQLTTLDHLLTTI